MKKLILTSMLTAVGLLAQSSGTTPAAPPKSNTTQAPASQTPAKTAKHKHKKNTNSNTAPAAKSGSTSQAPATPAGK